MILIETDLVLAIVSREDKHHEEAIELIEKFKREAALSPYSPVELDLLIKSGKIVVSDIQRFYELLGSLLDYRGVKLQPVKVAYHAKAQILRRRYGLGYFDSLHGGVAVVEGLELVSYDRVYDKVGELRYGHPRKYVKSHSN